MPTYLTPGVYVEEVPSANKPIEGVGTSIAAFVGLAPGGPVNTPMRISNWTQFAKIYGDPNEPDNGPFMEGAYLAHCRLRLLPERRRALLDRARRRRRRPTAPAPRRRRCPRRPTRAVEAFRARRARRASTTTSRSRSPRSRAEAEGDGRRRQTYTVVVTRRLRQREEYDGLTLKKGRNNLATKVNARLEADQDRGDRRVAARGAARPGDRARYTLSAPSIDAGEVDADALRGRRRPPRGHGRPGRRRRDHDGRACPDLMTLVRDGDDTSCATCRAR